MSLQKIDGRSHWRLTGGEDFLDLDAEIADCALRAARKNQAPAFERAAYAREIRPVRVVAGVHVQHRELGFGDEREPQRVLECDFAGLGKIRRMKDAFDAFHCAFA